MTADAQVRSDALIALGVLSFAQTFVYMFVLLYATVVPVIEAAS